MMDNNRAPIPIRGPIRGPIRDISNLLDSLTATVPQLSAVVRSIGREVRSFRSEPQTEAAPFGTYAHLRCAV